MSQKHPELVFGLVGAIGAELELVQRALQECLATVGYTAVDGVRLTNRICYPSLSCDGLLS